MKSLYYFGGAALAALVLVLMPHTATPPVVHAAEQQPRLDSWAPTQLNDTNFGGAYMTLQGQMWPDKQYGLSAALFDQQTNTQIPLETFSYTPLAERMVVQVPTYVKLPATTRAYDLILMTPNGTRTIADSAILLLINEPVLTTPPSGGTEEPDTTPPLIMPVPSTDIVQDTSHAPMISGYTQERVWSKDAGGILTIFGNGWPSTAYGLSAYLVGQNSGQRVTLETISYTPDAGKLIVQTPSYAIGAPSDWYDLYVITTNGERTTIHSALQYTT